MSRIDEALARARGVRPELPGLPLVPAAEVAPVFPAETAPVFPAETAPVFPAETAPVFPAETPEAGGEPATVVAVEEAGAHQLAAPIADGGATVLPSDATLPELPLSEKLMTRSQNNASVEQYRRLAARLYVAQSEHRTRVVMVTSALPGEGKTLSAANLALTLSESYHRQVLLVDADLRRPCVHEVFRIPNVGGLNDGVRAQTDRKVPLIRMSEHLSVLTAGRPDPDPMSVLSSQRMRQVLSEAGATFEWVIIDTPPIGMLSDAHLLTSLVDTVLLVVEAGQTPLSAINAAVEVVGRDRILGVILNRADEALPKARYGYDYQYDWNSGVEA